jgi:hypothetical protein
VGEVVLTGAVAVAEYLLVVRDVAAQKLPDDVLDCVVDLLLRKRSVQEPGSELVGDASGVGEGGDRRLAE